MMTHEVRSQTGIPAKRSSGNISMIITAFGFMVLMLVLTTPAAGPGPAPGIDHNPWPAQDNTTSRVAYPLTHPPITGVFPSPDPVLERVRITTNLSRISLPGTNP